MVIDRFPEKIHAFRHWLGVQQSVELGRTVAPVAARQGIHPAQSKLLNPQFTPSPPRYEKRRTDQ